MSHEAESPRDQRIDPARLAAVRQERLRKEALQQDPARHDPAPAHAGQPYDDPYSRDDPYPRGGHYHWRDPSSSGQFEDEARPLLDPSILVAAVWRHRNRIGMATVAGAVLGVVMALSTPHKYYAESRLFVDPREVRVTEDDIRNQQLSTEAMLAITDSQLQILSSTSVLEKVVTDLGLDRDPEFNGSMSSGSIGAGLSLIRDLFTGKSGASEIEQKALNNLRDAVSVGRDAKTFVIILGVDTRDPEKSALIANKIVETYLDSEGRAQSSLLERTSESIDTRINSLRADLDAAEREVERFKAENGLVGVAGQYIDDKVILALSDQLANARAMKVGIRVKADNLARVKIGDVLSGAFPEELLSSNLTELRKQYTQTKSNAESLATRLGPRHPQYIAAMSSLETITKEISAELRRIVASSQTELQRAVETEQELASQMAVAKSRAMDQSVEFVTLRELERKANATRGIYEAFLTRSRETSERSNLTTRNVRVISPAEAPMQPMGPSRKLIAIAGMAAGFFAGLGLATLAGAVQSIRAYNGAQPQGRFQTPPFGGYPEPPEPGPRTPPGGPGRRFWPRRDHDAGAFDAAADEATTRTLSGSRAQSDDQANSPQPRRAQPAAAQSGRVEPADAQQTSAAQSAPETAPGPHALMSANGQPHQTAPAQPASAASGAGQGPGVGQPLWTAYPPQPDYRYQPPCHHPRSQQEATHPSYPGYGTDPYAHAQPAFHPGYAAVSAGPVAAAPAYPMQPPLMTPAGFYAQPHPQAHSSFHPHYQPAPQMPAAQPYAAAYPAPMPAPVQLWPQSVPQAAAPSHPAAVAGQPAPYQASYQAPYQAPPAEQPAAAAVAPVAAEAPKQPAAPAGNAAVERIRREMDGLRSRIDGYGAERRRA